MDAEERNGRRRRQRAEEKRTQALSELVRVLEPLGAEARERVVRAACAWFDIALDPRALPVPKEGL